MQTDKILDNTTLSTRLKISKYAFFIENPQGHQIVYSSMTGLILSCSEPEYIDKLNAIRAAEPLMYDAENDLLVLLYEKKVLLDEDYDEELALRYLYEENIVCSDTLELMLIVTRQCNFRCVYCGQEHQDLRMSESVYDSVIAYLEKQLARKRYNRVSITFFGGEPLLEYKNILRFLRQVYPLLTDHNISFSSGMSSNGYLLTPERFEELYKYNCRGYQISVDGMDYTHNKTRFLVGGKPSWQQIMDNLQYMQDSDKQFSVIIRSNFNFEVADSMEEFYQLVAKQFDKRFQIYVECIKDHGTISPGVCDVMNSVESVVTETAIAAILKKNHLPYANLSERLRPARMICYASKPNFFVIDYDGCVKKCSHDFDFPANQLGQLMEDGRMDISTQKHAAWIYNDITAANFSGECNGCGLAPVCFGKKCPLSYLKNSRTMNCSSALQELEVTDALARYY